MPQPNLINKRFEKAFLFESGPNNDLNKTDLFMDIRGKENYTASLLHFNTVHLINGVILEHPPCDIRDLVNILGHVWRISIFWFAKEITGCF